MPVDDYIPSVQDVADLLRARTKELGSGREIGNFTDNTRPTAEEVTGIIEKSAGTVSLSAGDDVPAVLLDEVKQVVSWLAAMQVELSYFPEQVANDRSAYQQYKDLYDEAIGTPRSPGSLIVAIQNALTDNTVDVSGPRRPKANFPTSKPLTW